MHFIDDFEKRFMVGAVSSAAAKTLTAPIERVVLIFQTQDINPRILSGEIKRYEGGLWNCLQRVAKKQGVQALWRGNLVNVLRYFPVQGFNFAFKDTIWGVFPHPTGVKAKFVTHVVAGGMAGVCSYFIAYPLDYARLRLAADLGSFIRSFGGLYDVIDKTIKGPGGYWALYRGFGATALAIAPYRGIYFGVNDTFAELNPYQHRSDLAGLTTKFVQAQVAALTAAFVAYPLDTIRRRLQMQSEKPVLERAYTGALNCFSVMVKNEGPAALYKGAGSNAIRTVGSALVLVTYGELMDRSQKK